MPVDQIASSSTNLNLPNTDSKKPLSETDNKITAISNAIDSSIGFGNPQESVTLINVTIPNDKQDFKSEVNVNLPSGQTSVVVSSDSSILGKEKVASSEEQEEKTAEEQQSQPQNFLPENVEQTPCKNILSSKNYKRIRAGVDLLILFNTIYAAVLANDSTNTSEAKAMDIFLSCLNGLGLTTRYSSYARVPDLDRLKKLHLASASTGIINSVAGGIFWKLFGLTTSGPMSVANGLGILLGTFMKHKEG